MKNTSLILCCAGCAFVAAAGIGASKLLAAGGKIGPVWAAVTTPELPGEAAAQKLVLDTVGDFIAVRQAHPLSETQRQQITATLRAHRDDVVLQANARLKAQRLLRATILDGGDDEAVRTAARQVGTAMVEGAILRKNIASEVKPLLTVEQATAWRALLERIDDRLDVFFATQL